MQKALNNLKDEKKPAKPQTETKNLLCNAGPRAAKFLIDALGDDELSAKERTEIAKEILNRGFGKTAAVPAAKNLTQTVSITLGAEAEKYAE